MRKQKRTDELIKSENGHEIREISQKGEGDWWKGFAWTSKGDDIWGTSAATGFNRDKIIQICCK